MAARPENQALTWAIPIPPKKGGDEIVWHCVGVVFPHDQSVKFHGFPRKSWMIEEMCHEKTMLKK